VEERRDPLPAGEDEREPRPWAAAFGESEFLSNDAGVEDLDPTGTTESDLERLRRGLGAVAYVNIHTFIHLRLPRKKSYLVD
jgi:hypothetical protein